MRGGLTGDWVLLGWPLPAGSDLREAPKAGALLVNGISLLAAFIWWLLEMRLDRHPHRFVPIEDRKP